MLALALLRKTPGSSAPQIVREVAGLLRNTAAVCRKSYVHPRVLQACEAAEDVETLAPKRRRGLLEDECRLMALLALRERARARCAKRLSSYSAPGRGPIAGARLEADKEHSGTLSKTSRPP